jgi:endonuclease/exonuclease/phosphatase family metal-dependent hydrolase
MFRFKFLVLFLGIPLLFFSCVENEPLAQEANQSIEFDSDIYAFNNLAKAGRINAVRVMTRNIYIGTDVDIVLGADDPSQIPVLAAQAFQGLIATNFPDRAILLAKEIAITRPHLIGLQEVSLLRIQSPGDAVVGGTVPAEDVFMDYLDIFMSTLDAFGLKYKVAAKVQNVDVEIPMITGTDPLSFDDIRVTDFDVVLVRDEVEVSNVTTTNYQVNLPLPDLGIILTRGFITVDAKIRQGTYRFANTHLEPFYLPVRNAQAQELMATLDNSPYPVIMVGDFNTPAPSGETYQFIQSNGYIDIWDRNILEFNPDGFTFGHDPDLLNAEANFFERIDYIFVQENSDLLDPVVAVTVGDEQFNRTPSGLWPSDHAGVVARLRINTRFGRFARLE